MFAFNVSKALSFIVSTNSGDLSRLYVWEKAIGCNGTKFNTAKKQYMGMHIRYNAIPGNLHAGLNKGGMLIYL